MVSSNSKENLFILFLVSLWYSSNIGVILLNKYLLSNYGFKFPIFLTMCHMSACAVLSYVSIVFFKLVPQQMIKSRSQFIKIATLSIVFCGSVVGGNISLRYLAVSFNQAVGATTPFFTAVFAYLATLKREAWVTYAALVPVVAGVVIASGVCFLCFDGIGIGIAIIYVWSQCIQLVFYVILLMGICFFWMIMYVLFDRCVDLVHVNVWMLLLLGCVIIQACVVLVNVSMLCHVLDVPLQIWSPVEQIGWWLFVRFGWSVFYLKCDKHFHFWGYNKWSTTCLKFNEISMFQELCKYVTIGVFFPFSSQHEIEEVISVHGKNDVSRWQKHYFLLSFFLSFSFLGSALL